VSHKARVPWVTTLLTGLFVALWSLIGDANETYDLTNIGTLFAFALVCIGVMVLRHTDPDRPRPFRVPFVYFVGFAGAALCLVVMYGLPPLAWRRFAIWLGAGMWLYVLYGYRHSSIRRGTDGAPIGVSSRWAIAALALAVTEFVGWRLIEWLTRPGP
jgi:APA family basic amino acid/polyamine antiporter